jgi:hypothetical protein
LRMQNLKVLANRDLRRFKLTGEFGDEHPALVREQIENGAAAFFVQHGNRSEEISFRVARGATPHFFL